MEKDGLYCGYAPRVLRRLFTRLGKEEVLFVGSKDGSLTVLRRENDEQSFQVVGRRVSRSGTSLQKAVRVLIDWGSDHLIVGRDDGGMEVIAWRPSATSLSRIAEPETRSAQVCSPCSTLEAAQPPDSSESLRYATWLDRSQTRLLVAHRRAGTRLLTFHDATPGEDNFHAALTSAVTIKLVGVVRVAAAIPDLNSPGAPPRHFVLIDNSGTLWLWDSEQGQAIPPPREIGSWSDIELPPATFEDATYIGPTPDGAYKDIRALIVTTDTGVFALDLRRKNWEHALKTHSSLAFPKSHPQPIRLGLPGGHLFSTAVTYVEYRASDGFRAHLWLTSLNGESLLFENHPLGENDDLSHWSLGFRNSGRIHHDAQALKAVSWSTNDRIWLAKACRDDRVHISSYTAPQALFKGTQIDNPLAFLSVRCQPSDGALIKARLAGFLAESGHDISDWPGYALFAEFLEVLAHKWSSEAGLLDYLSQPSTEIPIALLVYATTEEPDGHLRLAAAVRLWTLCLLGIANRRPDPRTEWYLGIFRFLRGILQASNFIADSQCRNSLRGAIEKALPFSRKWGLYGQVNEVRQDLTSPLRVLEEQYANSIRTQLDQLTYYSLLFRRSYSELASDSTHKKEGDHAWAVKTLALDCGTLVAVSWRRQGITFFILASQADGSPEFIRASLPRELLPLGTPADTDVDRDRYAFSRDLLLLREGSTGNAFRLLTATRSARDSDLIDDLRLFSLELVPSESPSWAVECQWQRSLLSPKSRRMVVNYDSAYRFLDLGSDESGEHLVAIGLGGREGAGRIALLAIAADDTLTIRYDFALTESGPDQIPGSVPSDDLKAFRNRVWSLSQVKAKQNNPGRKAFVAGCDNGEIWYIELHSKRTFRRHLVAQLTSAVKALHADPEGLRVFAGTKDGTIIAFQEFERPGGLPYLSTLWATVEADEICYLDQHKYRTEELVFAVTRNGVCLAFDDRKVAASFDSTKTNPQRPPFPGIRRLRSPSGAVAFAAASFPNSFGLGNFAWRLVAVATADGCMRILSLHFPRYTTIRKVQFYEQCKRLWRVAHDSFIDGKPEKRILTDEPAFRSVEAASRSAPLLPLIIIRVLLDPGLEGMARKYHWLSDLESARSWCLPQNLRPVLKLRQRWDAVLREAKPTNKDIQGVGDALAVALDAAWADRNIDLFQEISALTLKRLNFQLFRSETISIRALHGIYVSLFDVIRGRLQLCLGSPERKEIRSRIIVAKNLLDGDTFYRLVQKSEQDPTGPWQEILLKRVEGAVELILVGNDLVSLESLRAANHSLVRLCRRFAEARTSSNERLRVLRWSFFKAYFSQLVHSAVQRLDANLRLSDAMAHEYCRTFALCLYACPEALLNISSDLVDARLIRDPKANDDFTRGIQGQVEVLSQVFGLAGLVDLWEFVKAVHLNFTVAELPGSSVVGEWENQKLSSIGKTGRVCFDSLGWKWLTARVREYGNLYRLAAGFNRFAGSLSSDARELQLATEKGIRLAQVAVPEEANRGVFPHSWLFWEVALRELASLPNCPKTSPERVRPETILFIERVADWAKHSVTDLERRYSSGMIFEPEHRVFLEILSRVERAARGFSTSAAVQKNLVVGILGHHLLEDLDIHVLELREIARNLDPDRVNDANDRNDRNLESVAGRFASLLVHRSLRGESLPKNLRALSKLLEPFDKDFRFGRRLKDLFSDEAWDLSLWAFADVAIMSDREREYLALALGEIMQNHEMHSGFKRGSRLPRPEWEIAWLNIKCPVRSQRYQKRWRLLENVFSKLGQEPCKPNPSPTVSSSGVGLYLSFLAAAMVGWRIRLRLEKAASPSEIAGWLVVELHPPNKERVLTASAAAHRLQLIRSAHKGSAIRNVVVIDDKAEVARFVWREVGNVTGFGSADDSDALEPLRPLVVPSGDITIWWVPATFRWKHNLAELIAKSELLAPAFFLVDVRGPVGNTDSTGKRYKCENVLSVLELRRPDDFPQRVWLISSYEHGTRASERGHTFEIRSKSPETFQKLREVLFPSKIVKRGKKSEETKAAHVLITGAGFEFRGTAGRQQLGMPSTRDLLRRFIAKVYGKREVPLEREIGFPVPRKFNDVLDLRAAAENGDLDAYWSCIFREEKERARDVLDMSERSYRLRAVFRSEFLHHDWGYLPQAVAAARVGFAAWISTNYTRFANRAIEISGLDWQTIEFGEEAHELNYQLLHRSKGYERRSVLFKVHGDLGHVLTMALSREDKTVETRLASFMPLYLAAQAFLQKISRLNSRVVWHIVGHGLKDELLVRIIKTACEESPAKHRFIAVAPLSDRDKTLLRHPYFELVRHVGKKAASIKGYNARADEYLAKLERVGIQCYQSAFDGFARISE